MAEWLKMELAAAHGICAATRVELPARFIWRAYRSVLGRSAVPAVSALDKQPLTWRFMQCLPEASRLPGFEPVASFLHGAGRGAGTGSTAGPEHDDGDAGRRLQLARRLADLFDQYQVYRSDWLADWAEGRDVLAGARPGAALSTPLPPDQRWQPALWRLVQETLSTEQREAARGALHQRFLRALREATG
jgi:exodeoxyribonuclease V gamma subunit